MTDKATQIDFSTWLVFWLLGLFIVGGAYTIGHNHGAQACETTVTP